MKTESLKPDFSNLILSIASSALLKMGLDPEGKEEKDRNIARYNIDLLSLLKEKTKNNLTEKEMKLLNSCIQDLQLKFVQTKQKEQTKQTEHAEHAKHTEQTEQTKHAKHTEQMEQTKHTEQTEDKQKPSLKESSPSEDSAPTQTNKKTDPEKTHETR